MVGGNLDFFTLNWFIEALIDETSMSENALLEGNFPGHAWLWAAMMARVAATSVKPSNRAEVQQIQEWKTIADNKIYQATRTLGLQNWDETEALLRTWVWQDSSLGVAQLKHIWEECQLDRIVASHPDAQDLYDTASPNFIDKRLGEDQKPIIVDDEAFDQCLPAVWI